MQIDETLSQVQRMRLVVIDQWSEHNLSCNICQGGNENTCPESQRLRKLLLKWSMLDIEMQEQELKNRDDNWS